MNKQQVEFLLKYAEIGVLLSMESSNAIKSEELKQEYIKIKKELTNAEQDAPVKNNQKNSGEKKENAATKWFKGIGDRQRKYQEEHKKDVI